MTDTFTYDYDRSAIVDSIEGLAQVRLSGGWTLDLIGWEDGDFVVEAFHTIDETYPWDEIAAGEAVGLPFYRERIAFSTLGDEQGWLRHEVVRRRVGDDFEEIVWSEKFGGYTPNWPDPLHDEEDDEDEDDGFGFGYQGRFA